MFYLTISRWCRVPTLCKVNKGPAIIIIHVIVMLTEGGVFKSPAKLRRTTSSGPLLVYQSQCTTNCPHCSLYYTRLPWLQLYSTLPPSIVCTRLPITMVTLHGYHGYSALPPSVVYTYTRLPWLQCTASLYTTFCTVSVYTCSDCTAAQQVNTQLIGPHS